MNLVFVMVEPAVPENVGAAARAMKTMGFSQLRLVNGCDHLCDRARRLAHGSNDILENARCFDSLADSLADVDFSIATTAKNRRVRDEYHLAENLLPLLAHKKKSIQTVALVFGREDRGLHNREITQCDTVSRIHLQRKYPSLNLGQAVMLYAYELSPLALTTESRLVHPPMAASFAALRQSIAAILATLDLPLTATNRLTERIALLTDTDVRLLHSVVRELKRTNPALRDATA